VSRRPLFGAFWPTAKQEALLRLVLGHEDDVERRWRELQPLDLDLLDPGSFCMLPLLHTRLSARHIEDPLADRIAGTYRSTWYRNQLAFRCLSTTIAEIEEHGAAPIVFGGASLAARFYEHLAHRPLPQLDLLVRPEEAAASRDALLRSGDWRVDQERPAYVRLENNDHIVLVLHRGLPSYLAGAAGPHDALELLRPRMRRVTLGSIEAAVLGPADEVVVACGLGARVTTPPSIQWLLDTAAVLARGECPPTELVAAASELNVIAAVRDSVAYLHRAQERVDLDGVHSAFRTAGLQPSRHERVAYVLGGVGGRFGGTAQRLASFSRSTMDASASQTLHAVSAGFHDLWHRRRPRDEAFPPPT
jgi:Uncharacterised nucleotidyltransferase